MQVRRDPNERIELGKQSQHPAKAVIVINIYVISIHLIVNPANAKPPLHGGFIVRFVGPPALLVSLTVLVLTANLRFYA